ncbi:MAG: prepilin-type N-terminal cleavage/methylation domain-containing protein [Deltaproteobacteria bacterium]|nr:prepilin-type N-terminal cleavage/methylation domain-containing protein [Deltaproteobacteria bacterium]
MIRQLRPNNEKGFTLIELMIVIAIIGILAAIAIPNFLSYRQRGFNADALSDAKNFYTACVANSTGQTGYVWATGNNPPGYDSTEPTGGGFTYNATSGEITCDATFKHAQGTVIYTLTDAGGIGESGS